MRYSVQFEPDEVKALLATCERVVLAVLQRSHYTEPSVVSVPPPESFGNDASPGAAVTPLRVVPPASEAVAPASSAISPEEEKRAADTAKALHGRDLWLALIEMWRQGFGVEGVPQPDRVNTLLRVLLMDGGSVFAYLRTKKGITDATRDVLTEIHQRPLDREIKREARLLAENIAQVSSFHAPDLTERLEYTAEFHHIED